MLVGSIAALAASSAPETAVSIAHDIHSGRTGLLTGVQTSHATGRAVAALVAREVGSLASLARWASRGKAVLRVNAAGILAKVRSPTVESEAVGVLRTDPEVRELYLTAVAYRVLGLGWDRAADLIRQPSELDPAHVERFAAEVTNPNDAGARWCSVVFLSRCRPELVSSVLVTALAAEQSRENLRAIGAVLGGVDPLSI